MNPQADNDAESLKRRLNQLPPARPTGPLSVPSRSGGMHDIDDSAFEPEDTPQPQIVRPAPVVPQRADATSPVILPAALPRLPQYEPPEPAPTPTPAPPAPVQPTVPPAPAVVSPPPAPPVPPEPASVPAPPPTVMPPSSPPAVPQPVAPPPQPPEPPRLPPMPVTPVEHTPAPTPAFNPAPASILPGPASVATNSTPVSYQPATPHIAKDLIERIDETPQQNSKDIEGLIEHNHRLHRIKSFASFLVFCAGVVIAAFLINQYIFQSYYVDGTSMTPTLQNDDRLIIDKVERTFANLQGKSYIPERGQVVVLDSSIVGFNGREEQLIKRVIGLPGDTVIIKDGAVTIKNKQNPDGFDVNRQLGLRLADTYVDSPQEWTIEEGKVFVMGDNRAQNGSYDSRAFGPIESGKIVGRLWARLLPFEKAQVF